VELAEILDLGRYILLNRGEEKTGGRRKRALLADAYEALLGAMYMDGGVSVTDRFLRREMRYKLKAIDPSSMIGADYKSALQERLQAAGGPVPEYAVIEVLGPDHRRTFRVELRVRGRALTLGEGHTIKIAQQEAAREALASSDSIESIVSDLYHEADLELEEDYVAIADESVESEMEQATGSDYSELSQEATGSYNADEPELPAHRGECSVYQASAAQSLADIVDEALLGGEDEGAMKSDAEADDEAHTVAGDA
jgi:hypothetical protein